MFQNRQQAGKLLGEKIAEDIGEIGEIRERCVVLGIPRGGVVVGKEVADVLNCSLDVIVVKKLGAPGQQELAIGAIGETKGSQYIDERLMQDLNVLDKYLEQEIKAKTEEIKRREQVYRQGKPPLDLKDKIVIIVDDGAATGATIIAAVREVWNHKPKKVIIGLPVIAKDTLQKLEKEADEVIFLEAPRFFYAVGQFYQNFPQISDEIVKEILRN